MARVGNVPGSVVTPEAVRLDYVIGGIASRTFAKIIDALALASGGRLYAAHEDGRLKVFDTVDGKVIAERGIPAVSWDAIAIADGRLYLTTRSGEVLCLGK